MAFAQLTYRESLRDIDACLGAIGAPLLTLRSCSSALRSSAMPTTRPASLMCAICMHWTQRPSISVWRCFSGPGSASIRPLSSGPPATGLRRWGDSKCTRCSICMARSPPSFTSPTARCMTSTCSTKSPSKPVPSTSGLPSNRSSLLGWLMNRGYIDFECLYRFTLSSAFFVVRTKTNVLLQRRYSRPVDWTTGLRRDHTVILTSRSSATAYPDALRRVTYCIRRLASV